MRSVVVVFPASMWAIIPMFRRRWIGIWSSFCVVGRRVGGTAPALAPGTAATHLLLCRRRKRTNRDPRPASKCITSLSAGCEQHGPLRPLLALSSREKYWRRHRALLSAMRHHGRAGRRAARSLMQLRRKSASARSKGRCMRRAGAVPVWPRDAPPPRPQGTRTWSQWCNSASNAAFAFPVASCTAGCPARTTTGRLVRRRP